MLTDLPAELLSIVVANDLLKQDLYNLRLTSRGTYTKLAENFGRRFFRRLRPQYTTHSLERLLQISQVASIRDSVEQLTLIVVEPLYRDVDALQEPIKARVIQTRAASFSRSYRPNRTDSWPLPVFLSPDFNLEWLALQNSINERCATMFQEAMANFAQAQKPPILLLQYHPRKWDGYGSRFGSTDALARLIGIDASRFGWREPVRAMAPVFSSTHEWAYPISGIEFGSGSHEHFWGVSTFEPLLQVPPSAVADLRRLTLELATTAADLDDDRDEGFRYMLSLATSLAEVDITFCPGDQCFLTSDYMSTLAHCISDAPLTSISITNGRMSSAGLGNVLESHSETLRSLQLYFVSFGDDDDSSAISAMFEQVSTFPMLTTLDLVGLTHRGTDVAIDMETLGSFFSARGRVAVEDLWRKFMACYCVE